MSDIEDIIQSKINTNILEFTKELAGKHYSSRKEYDKEFVSLRKKYKMCPKKTDIRACIKDIDPKDITEEFLKYSIRKLGKSSSGVTVITLLTSPFPQYTKDNQIVEQSFSCGKNCAYCPNEPEVKIHLTIICIEIDKLHVVSKENLNHIRVINHILYKGVKYDVDDSINFTDHHFTLIIKDHPFHINDDIIGVKIAQPRSYISSEPAVLRANRNNFDVYKQINDRVNTLINMGHPLDKLEIIILGGTWDHYPLEYRNEFIRDIYYSVNILGFVKNLKRNKYSLNDEISINSISQYRIIGITTETRPDCITKRSLINLRKMNVTRVQLGVQHIEDDVLRYIKRDCYLKDTITSNYRLKQNGYKVDMHLMPDLPGSSYLKDIHMFQKIFSHKKVIVNDNYIRYTLEHPELQADQLKIYPCATVPHTQIKEWYDNGIYKPYSEDKDTLIKLLIYVKTNVYPWIRLNRIVRDIPQNWIEGGNKDVSLRQYLLKTMKQNNLECNCIRCREVKDLETDIDKAELFTYEYNGLNATEYFLSFELPDHRTLYGFLRLRINHTNDEIIYDDFKDSAFIRELHVYGSLSRHYEKGKNSQHRGFGKRLIQEAEKIVKQYKINKLYIISGVGVREYYKYRGYDLHFESQMMVKYFTYNNYDIYQLLLFLSIFLIVFSIIYEN